MIELTLIKTALANSQLTLTSQGPHYDNVWGQLKEALGDDHLDDFSPFMFAWSLLPMWSKLMLLSIARHDHADAFIGIGDLTPLEQYNPRQLSLLMSSCGKVLQTSVTLFSDWHFTTVFYPPYREARKNVLAQRHSEKTITDAIEECL